MKHLFVLLFCFGSSFLFSQNCELKGTTKDSLLVLVEGFDLNVYRKTELIKSSRITSCKKLLWKNEENCKVRFFNGELVLGEIYSNGHCEVKLENFK